MDFEEFDQISEADLVVMLSIEAGLAIMASTGLVQVVYLGDEVAELRHHESGAVARVTFGYDNSQPHMAKLQGFVDRKAAKKGVEVVFEDAISYAWLDRLVALWLESVGA